MGQAPKFLHITQLAKLKKKKKKKNHSKSSTHNPTSQILKKITVKTIGSVKLQNFIRITQLAKFYPKARQKH